MAARRSGLAPCMTSASVRPEATSRSTIPSSRACTAIWSAVVGVSPAMTDALFTFGASGSAGIALSSSARASITPRCFRFVFAVFVRSGSWNLTAGAVSVRNLLTAATSADLFTAIVFLVSLDGARAPGWAGLTDARPGPGSVRRRSEEQPRTGTWGGRRQG